MSVFLVRKWILIVFCCATAVGCSPSEPLLSEDQLAHKNSLDYCMRLHAEGGTTWKTADQAGRTCERLNPTKPEFAKQQVMELLAKRGLAGENQPLYSLMEGDCKDVATQYVALHEKAYRLNSGPEKIQAVEEADLMLANLAEKGLCTPKTRAAKK